MNSVVESEEPMHGPPRVRHSRRTDATGIFWLLVLLFLAGFASVALGSVAALVCLAACPVCFAWQIIRWRADAVIVREATEWCRLHYPGAGDTSIVDFVIAVAHEAHEPVHSLSPATRLDYLNPMAAEERNGDGDFPCADVRDLNAIWLARTCHAAHINGIDVRGLQGETFGDAINQIVTTQRSPTKGGRPPACVGRCAHGTSMARRIADRIYRLVDPAFGRVVYLRRRLDDSSRSGMPGVPPELRDEALFALCDAFAIPRKLAHRLRADDTIQAIYEAGVRGPVDDMEYGHLLLAIEDMVGHRIDLQLTCATVGDVVRYVAAQRARATGGSGSGKQSPVLFAVDHEGRAEKMVLRAKSNAAYLVWRVLWVMAFLSSQVLGLWQLVLMAKGNVKDATRLLLYAPVMMVLLLPVVFMLFSVCVFTFNFSIFGKYMRTPWPEERPIAEHSHSSGRVKWVGGTIPFFTWVLFPSGLGFSIMFVGRGFIPLRCMSRIDKGAFACTLTHESEEVRSPVSFPHEDIYACLQERLNR